MIPKKNPRKGKEYYRNNHEESEFPLSEIEKDACFNFFAVVL